MQMRALIMLAIALIMGGIAVYLVNSLITREAEVGTEARPVGLRPVVVAVTDLDVGTRLDKVMLKTVDWPEASVPEGAYAEIDSVIGEKPPVILKEIRTGEPVLSYKVSPGGARGGLTPRIPVDKRAVTIAVNEVRGVAGFVLPGDRVDIMLTSTQFRADNQPVTRTLLQNVMVLGVDQSSSEKEAEPKVVNAVTLLVTPAEGKKLTLAQTIGSLNLMLRNEGDINEARDEVISLASLQSYVRPTTTKKGKRVVRRAAPSGTTVTIIRGLSTSKQRVKDPSKPVASGEAGKSAN